MFKCVLAVFTSILLLSCAERTSTVGWDYNDPKNGGFQKVPFIEQETPPGMVLVEGGSYLMNYSEDEQDSLTVTSFYISKYEETNGQYLVYLDFLKEYYSEATYLNALPDTTVWKEMELNPNLDYLVNNYLRNPIYKDYPVLGLSPEQIIKYANWKTDRINEYILIREGIHPSGLPPTDSNNVFVTEKYFSGQYDPESRVKNIPDLNPDYSRKRSELGERAVRVEDALLLPRMRLLSEDEWQLANLALGDSNYKYVKTPKHGYSKRYDKHGQFIYLDDLQNTTMNSKPENDSKILGLNNVYASRPNNYHIYNLNTNISEIVGDTVSYSTIGGSYFSPYPNNSGIYNKSIPNWFKYDIRFYLNDSQEIDSKQTGLCGFRLAMDRYGSPISEGKNKRFKGK